MKKAFKIGFLLITLGFIFSSCEDEITLNLPQPAPRLIVEGYIETGLPPYVLLSYNIPVGKGINIFELEKYFVKNGKITVSDGTTTITLREYIPAEIKEKYPEFYKELAERIGFEPDIFSFFPLSVYTIDSSTIDFVGERGKTYRLNIELENDSILGDVSASSITTIVSQDVNFDSLWITPHPDPDNDTLVNLNGLLKDPPALGNYYRYFTKVNSGPWLINLNTVFDDILANGKDLTVEIPKGIAIADIFSDFDFETYGFFKKSDTCYVRIALIDKAHYDFWRTAEEERNNLGSPFARGIKVKSNIVGGFGIWGGLSSNTSMKIAE